jgi:hypothetical protein
MQSSSICGDLASAKWPHDSNVRDEDDIFGEIDNKSELRYSESSSPVPSHDGDLQNDADPLGILAASRLGLRVLSWHATSPGDAVFSD